MVLGGVRVPSPDLPPRTRIADKHRAVGWYPARVARERFESSRRNEEKVKNKVMMKDTEQLLTMMSNVLGAIKEGQKASQEVAKQVEELAQLRRSDIMFQSQKNSTCSTLSELTEWHASDDERNVLLFKDGTLLVERCVYDLQTLLENAKTSTTTYIVWKQL